MSYNWMPIYGKFDSSNEKHIFLGEKMSSDEEVVNNIGLYICDQIFTGGEISVDVTFKSTFQRSAAEIVLYFDPQTKNTVNAGLTTKNLFSIRHFESKWIEHALGGNESMLEANRTYHVKVIVNGSLITLYVDNVEVLKTTLPYSVPQSQIGLFSVNDSNVEFKNFTIINERPKAFVVMEFSAPYNDVYEEVIKSVCGEIGIDVLRIDEESGPGLIIADIVKAIVNAKVVIAEISPNNPNVFYEVGYAHALNKPTILIAEKGTKLPFDVSPFRTLFYENSIVGKNKLIEGLKRHILSSLRDK